MSRLMGMDDATWRRHAHPWSVWTRIPILPLLALAIWSRIWLGVYAAIPVAVLAVWAAVNPRVFPEPVSTESWSSKGVLGERIWTERDRTTLPARHRLPPHALTSIAILGTIVLVWGLYALRPWPTLAGTTVALLAKLWFFDRMVWLYEDVETHDPDGA